MKNLAKPFLWITLGLLLFTIVSCSKSSTKPEVKKVINNSAKTLTVLSYNILEGMKTDVSTNKQLFTAWVGIQNPDIFAIQEANKFTEESLNKLAKSYGHPYSAIVKLTGYPVALTSKYPITAIERVNTGMTHGFIIAKILDYNIVVLHLNPHNYEIRRSEIQIVLDKITENKATNKLLVMGDFNSYSPLYAANFANGTLVNTLRQREIANPGTKYLDNGELDFKVQQRVLDYGLLDIIYEFEKKDPQNAKIINPTTNKIDYIYCSNDLISTVESAHFIKDDFTKVYSDHLPIIIKLKH